MNQGRRTAVARWLWRGHLYTGGNWIGRWRDTFTPEHLRGYEGAVGMIRAGDVYYPTNYPRSVEESRGVAINGGRTQIRVPFPLAPIERKTSLPPLPPQRTASASSSRGSESKFDITPGASALPSLEERGDLLMTPTERRTGPTWNTGSANGRKRHREDSEA